MAQELTSSSSRAMDRIKAAKAGLGRIVKPSRDDFRLKGPNKPAERRQGLVPLDPAGPPPTNRRNRRVSLMEDEKDAEPDEEAKAKMIEEVDEDPLLDVMEYIPEEYKKHHQDTEPMLHFLRQVSEEEKLSTLMMAAQQDVRLHQARIKASEKRRLSPQGLLLSKGPAFPRTLGAKRSSQEPVPEIAAGREDHFARTGGRQKDDAHADGTHSSQVGEVAAGVGAVRLLPDQDGFGFAGVAGKTNGRDK
jgi:hypothetical protein